jgi:hypothetical protein
MAIMRLLIGLSLIIGGICGTVLGFLGNVAVDFPYMYLSAVEISFSFGIYSFVVFFGGLYITFSTG